MSKNIILSCDSTCDMGSELYERYHISVMPLHVQLGDQSYRDNVDLFPDDIYRTYAEKKILPKTAAISVGEYTEYFQKLTADGSEVIHFNISSEMSCTHLNAKMAAQEVEGVYAVDTHNLSTGSALIVLEAVDLIAKGLGAAQVAEELTALIPKCRASFVVDTLEFLHKGGRCSSIAMMGANLLQLHPCIDVDAAAGKMVVGKKYRGSLDKALEQYVADKLKDRTDIKLDRVFITSSGISDERMEAVRKAVAQYADFKEVFITRAGCTVSAHCGPNTLGVLFMTK